jgi:hypothetical protein
MWQDAPDKAGSWWMSPKCDGLYQRPHIMEVVDYDRPGRHLEFWYGRDTIPVKLLGEYYPESKWLFIPIPKWDGLK